MKHSGWEGEPSCPAGLLAAYANLLERSSRMLACMHRQDWFSLVEEQSRYVIEVESLSKAEGNLDLSENERERKAALLERILEQDIEIRRGLLERREELQKLIGVSQRKRDLVRSYGVRPPFDKGQT